VCCRSLSAEKAAWAEDIIFPGAFDSLEFVLGNIITPKTLLMNSAKVRLIKKMCSGEQT